MYVRINNNFLRFLLVSEILLKKFWIKYIEFLYKYYTSKYIAVRRTSGWHLMSRPTLFFSYRLSLIPPPRAD